MEVSLVACVRFQDKKNTNYYIDVCYIKYNKHDKEHIKPVNINDFDKRHEYHVLWCNCKGKCIDGEKVICNYYKAYIVNLGESVDDVKQKMENKTSRIIFPKHPFTESSESDIDDKEDYKSQIHAKKQRKEAVHEKHSQAILNKFKQSNFIQSRRRLILDDIPSKTLGKCNKCEILSQKNESLLRDIEEKDKKISVFSDLNINLQNILIENFKNYSQTEKETPLSRKRLETSFSRKRLMFDSVDEKANQKRAADKIERPELSNILHNASTSSLIDNRRTNELIIIDDQRAIETADDPLRSYILDDVKETNNDSTNEDHLENEKVSDNEDEDFEAYKYIKKYKPKLFKNLIEKGLIKKDDCLSQEAFKRYDVVNDKVFLGLDITVGQVTWQLVRNQKQKKFFRNIAGILWKKHDLANRCLDLSKISRGIPGRSPTKICTPKKINLFLALIEDYLRDKSAFSHLTEEQKELIIKSSCESLTSQIRDLKKEEIAKKK